MRALIAALLLCAVAAGALDLVSPLADPVESCGWGFRVTPIGGWWISMHNGVDLTAPVGTPVQAAGPGDIGAVWYPKGTPTATGGVYPGHPQLGGAVYIEHDPRTVSVYGHLSRILVAEGDHVETGDVIGIIGNTGISTGVHLHFSVLRAPEFRPQPPPPDPAVAYWRRQLAGFMVAEQEAIGE